MIRLEVMKQVCAQYDARLATVQHTGTNGTIVMSRVPQTHHCSLPGLVRVVPGDCLQAATRV